GSQLVLSADRIPSELSTLASRLRDRFEWGLTVAVEPPNLATRLTVLRRLVEEAGVEIADSGALTELANRIDANVRQLHGALTRVIAHASLMARPLSRDLIAEIIPRGGRGPKATSAEEIQQRVAERFGISRAELVGSSRAATPLRARQVAIFLTRELTELSLPQIGRLYGGRDHTTVLNSLRRVEAGLDEDSDLAEKVRELRGAIHNPVGGER
ncbi:MAG TPA: DnaA/Hda family protein, partial [Solirubrobacterales bacterium]|nr:DnaA/Hda family protein [Solirubrobacterales bacterium]